MKKILQKSLYRLQALLLLVVMFVAGGSAMAQSPDAAFSITGKSNQTQSGTVNGVNWTCHLSPWAGGANFFSYESDLFTVEAPDSKVITKIVMTLCDQSNTGGTATLDRDGGDVGELIYADGKATWTGESDYVQYTRTGNRDWSFNYVEVWLADAGADDGSVKSTLNFDSWNLSYSEGSSKPASSTHFNNGEVFSNADGVTLTLTNIPNPQNWPNECYYSNPSGSTMALFLCNGEGFTIGAPSGYNITKILVNRASTSYSMTSLIIDGVQNTDGAKGTWTGEATSVDFSTISGDASKRILVSNIQVTLMPILDEGEVTYTIDLVDAPTGAYVTLDDQRFEDDSTYPVEKSFGKNDLTVYEPAGYYAEVEYTRDSHTYTVTYHAYNYYDVTVTGTTDPAAGVVYNEQTYGNGARIESKDVLNGSSVTAADVANMTGTVSMIGNTYNVDYQEKLDFVIMTNTNETSYYNSEYDVTVTCLATWSNCLNFWRSADLTVESSTFLIKKVEFEELYGATISGTSLYGGISNSVWEGTPTDKITFSTTSGDYRVKKLHIYVKKPQVSTYTIKLVDAPAGASVLVNNEKTVTTAFDTYSTIAVLNASNAVVTCPETHYYEKVYDEDTHTFTITFHEFYHYAISVTGCADASAGVRYDYRTYGNEETIQVKEPLTDGDVTAVTINGYTAAAPVVGTLDDHDATISVVYTEASEIDYTVTITGMPVGASVMIENEEFFASGTHKSRMTLNAYDASVKNCPETHYTNEQYEWYDEDSQTFNIVFTPYLAYTIAVDEASAYTGADAGVKVYNSNTYVLGQTIYNKTDLTENDVQAADVDGYTGTVSLSGNEFTVSYTKNEFILFKADTDPYWTGTWYDVTKEGVTLRAWEYGPSFGVNEDYNSPLSITSNAAPIVKVEIEYVYPDGDHVTDCNVGTLNNNKDEWTGSTTALSIWDNRGWNIQVSAIKVYLAKETTYHVNIAGMPAQGATVIVNNDYVNGYYTEDGSYDYVTYDELNESSVSANYPKSHQVEKNYDASTKTFSITYTALPSYEYIFAVEPYEDTNLKVYIDGEPYGDGVDYYTFYRELTLDDIETPEYEGYYANPSVKIENFGSAYLITVTYTPLPTIAISSSATDREGNYWTSFSFEKPISLAEGFTPCIVTGAENGKLTIQEFETVNDETSTMLDFNAGEVMLSGGRLISYEGNNGVDITMTGGKVESTTLQQPCSITFSSASPIKSIKVTPYGAAKNLPGYGYGAVCSLNGGSSIRVEDNAHTFDVNANSCTLSFANGGSGNVYISYIEVITCDSFIPVIPANTGILVKSSESASKIAYTIHEESEVNTDVTENLLKASGESGFSVSNDANHLYYKLTLNSAKEEGSAGFYWDKNSDEGHTINVPAHKAYLMLDASADSNRAAYHFSAEEILTGVYGINAEDNNDPVYNLQGQRINTTKAGVYVKNGRKFIVK